MINSFLERLKESNKISDHSEMAELMLEVQNYLIEMKYLNINLMPAKGEFSKDISELLDIFLNVRREYQLDDEEVNDFSYLSTAWDWLTLKGIKINHI